MGCINSTKVHVVHNTTPKNLEQIILPTVSIQICKSESLSDHIFPSPSNEFECISNCSFNSDFKKTPTLKSLNVRQEFTEEILMEKTIKILYAEDETVTQKLFIRFIQNIQKKYNCTIDLVCVCGGEAIIEEIVEKETEYDAIISDNYMGTNIDGLSALTQICCHNPNLIPKVVLVSANESAIASDGHSFMKIPKPITQKKLVHIISKILELYI